VRHLRRLAAGMEDSMDQTDIRAIDIHTHLATPEAFGELAEMGAYFRTDLRPIPIEETVELYRGLRARAVIFGVDTETQGQPYIGNRYTADLAARFPETLIGFASVDPWKGRVAIEEVRRSVQELGLKGVKLMPITQRFRPDDRRFSELFEEIAGLGVPLIIHVGHTGVGAGQPGGGGMRLGFGRPIHLDELSADHPELVIVAAHPGWPWHDELLSVMLHKPNVWMDLSGWAPRYLPESVVRYADTLLQDRVLFGTDYPVISPERWLAEFDDLPIRDAVRPKILRDNAIRLLGLEELPPA
jgi:predicted TIM-barrel fold metal-dependent hydrolase